MDGAQKPLQCARVGGGSLAEQSPASDSAASLICAAIPSKCLLLSLRNARTLSRVQSEPLVRLPVGPRSPRATWARVKCAYYYSLLQSCVRSTGRAILEKKKKPLMNRPSCSSREELVFVGAENTERFHLCNRLKSVTPCRMFVI